jgi:molybdopterin molybdotransferase
VDPEQYSDLIAGLAPAPETETVRTEDAAKRVLAEDVIADQSVPSFPSSAMDGYAFDAQALELARSGSAVPVCGDVPAGHPTVPIRPGCAVRVMTGAHVPTGAEAVVPVELTDASPTGPAPHSVHCHDLPATISVGWNIRAIDEDIRAGDVVIASGSRLSAAGVGTLITIGRPEVEVEAPLRVGVIVTGDELGTEEVGSENAPQIRNSNLPMLIADLHALGAEAVPRTCTDDTNELTAILTELADFCDLIITTGGISAGAFEVVRQTLGDAHSNFRRLSMRPGAPQGHGRFADTALLHLPGTPQGAFVGFHLFAASLLRGQTLRTRWRKAVYEGPEVNAHPRSVTFRPGHLTASGGVRAGERARLRDFSDAEVIIRIPSNSAPIADGDIIDVIDC